MSDTKADLILEIDKLRITDTLMRRRVLQLEAQLKLADAAVGAASFFIHAPIHDLERKVDGGPIITTISDPKRHSELLAKVQAAIDAYLKARDWGVAVSKSEYKRLKAMGVNVLPPNVVEDSIEDAVANGAWKKEK